MSNPNLRGYGWNPRHGLGCFFLCQHQHNVPPTYYGAWIRKSQKIIHKAERHPPPSYGAAPFDPINTSVGIYLDTINIFIRIASILAGNQRKWTIHQDHSHIPKWRCCNQIPCWICFNYSKVSSQSTYFFVLILVIFLIVMICFCIIYHKLNFYFL